MAEKSDSCMGLTSSQSLISYLQVRGLALLQVEGITLPIMEQALRQAADGRRHILQQMEACAPAPSRALGPHTPRIAKVTVRHICSLNTATWRYAKRWSRRNGSLKAYRVLRVR